VTIDSALLPEFGNEASRVIHILVPPGETIFEGYAAQQRLRLGGGSQVYLLRVDPSWEVK
jgi:filamentous hemagglutinin